MSRAQCFVLKGAKILMMQMRLHGEEWWCLPGGRIKPDEPPETAALRELKEECCVEGRILKRTGAVEYAPDDQHFTFLVEIGDQVPVLGHDPEDEGDEKVLVGVKWFSLEEISEVDRVYLWTAGLLTIPAFAREVQTWCREPSYPAKRGG